MTSFEILPFDINAAASEDEDHEGKLSNWPVVYVLNGASSSRIRLGQVYVGETLSFNSRMRQHLHSQEKRDLRTVRVVLDETFNKSVCLDLESYLIRLASGDDTITVLNRNDGIVDRDYYRRADYRETFDDIFAELRSAGVFQRSIPEIINSELFKLSPFKALNDDQAAAVDDIMEGLSEDLLDDQELGNLIYVQGNPGTGKTVVAVYLMKLIADIGESRDTEGYDPETRFSEFFLEGNREQFESLRIGLVVPQQALRKSLRTVFSRTPGLDGSMVMTPFEVGKSPETFDLLIVDEAHRLTQYGSQAMGTLTREFKDINAELFNGERPQATQLDWLRAKSRFTLLMVDTGQKVRPLDMRPEDFPGLQGTSAQEEVRRYRLRTQMRSEAGDEYIDYVRSIFSGNPPVRGIDFAPYELGIVDSPRRLVQLVHEREGTHGLSRVVAGYAWKWASKKDKTKFDIELEDGVRFQWNTKLVDWVSSRNALDEAGSIHTIQGYDLNYAGVIIGRDLRYDLAEERLYVDRSNYHDAKGKANNTMAGQHTSDQDLLQYICNIYVVLMTRGIKGTWVHVRDAGLREYLGRFFPVLG